MKFNGYMLLGFIYGLGFMSIIITIAIVIEEHL